MTDPRFTIGMVADWQGQRYELVDIRPHSRRDGTNTAILIWRSQCITCGASFEAKDFSTQAQIPDPPLSLSRQKEAILIPRHDRVSHGALMAQRGLRHDGSALRVNPYLTF